MHRKGYIDCGIQEVLESSGVPKGSFYYHFKSKEDFGLQVLDLYASVMMRIFQEKMNMTDRPVVERIRAFFRDMTTHVVENEFTGCPLGNLSQEMGVNNESFGRKLSEIFDKLELDLAEYLREAEIAGEIDGKVNPEPLAVFLVSSWEGALLRMKLTQNTKPFDIFDRTAFDILLNGE